MSKEKKKLDTSKAANICRGCWDNSLFLSMIDYLNLNVWVNLNAVWCKIIWMLHYTLLMKHRKGGNTTWPSFSVTIWLILIRNKWRLKDNGWMDERKDELQIKFNSTLPNLQPVHFADPGRRLGQVSAPLCATTLKHLTLTKWSIRPADCFSCVCCHPSSANIPPPAGWHWTCTGRSEGEQQVNNWITAELVKATRAHSDC